MNWKYFLPEEPNVPEYYSLEPDLFEETVELPKELANLEVVEKEKGKVIFNRGVDSKGEEYSIYLLTSNNVLVLHYNNSDRIMTSNPKKKDYDRQLAELNKYLKAQ